MGQAFPNVSPFCSASMASAPSVYDLWPSAHNRCFFHVTHLKKKNQTLHSGLVLTSARSRARGATDCFLDPATVHVPPRREGCTWGKSRNAGVRPGPACVCSEHRDLPAPCCRHGHTQQCRGRGGSGSDQAPASGTLPRPGASALPAKAGPDLVSSFPSPPPSHTTSCLHILKHCPA